MRVKRPENLCITSIDVPPSHQQWFLKGANITYFNLKHSIFTINLLFLSFFISSIKGMGAFGFTVIKASFKSLPSAYYFNQNVCNNCMEETSPVPPAPQTFSRLYCSELYQQCRQQLKILQKTQIRTIFFEFTGKTSTIEPQFALN